MAQATQDPRLKQRQQLPFFLRHSQMHAAYRIFGQHFVNSVQERGHSGALCRRDVHSARVVQQGLALLRRQQINLVHHPETRFPIDFQFLEHLLYLRVLFRRQGAAGIGNVKHQRCALYLFQRRSKRRNQRVRQVADESDCV